MRNLGWVLLGIYAAMVAIGLYLQAITQTPFGGIPIPLPVFVVFYCIIGLWVAIGALIIYRHPTNPIGWILSFFLIAPAVDQLAFGYIAFLVAGGRGYPSIADFALIWLNWSGMPFGIFAFLSILLLSPDGRFQSRNWRWVAWLALGFLAIYLLTKTFEPGQLVLYPSLNNPMGVSERIWMVLGPLMWAGLVGLMGCYLAACAELILKIRRGTKVDNQRLRWLVFPAALFGAGVPVVLLGEHGPTRAFFDLGGAIQMLAVAGMVAVIAFSIFKYRLYDLDIIINRGMVYGALTGALTSVYFLSVILLQQIFPAGSPLVTVLSTLLIAGLFSPLRRRIQRGIDRRFYRRRYNAEQALARFGAVARDEVEIEKLVEALFRTVESTINPKHISIWLRETK